MEIFDLEILAFLICEALNKSQLPKVVTDMFYHRLMVVIALAYNFQFQEAAIELEELASNFLELDDPLIWRCGIIARELRKFETAVLVNRLN